MRRLDGLLQGDYRTLFRGFGLDLADLREYQYGDDVRHIDWNVTARLQTPYVREYHEDREVTAWFLLDLCPSVDFGSGAGAQARRGGGFRRGAGAHPHAPRQQGRRAVLRRGRRHHDPGAQRPAPRAAHPARDARAPGAASATQPTDLGAAAARRRRAPDAAPLAGVRGVRLHQRAGLGGAPRPARAAPRGGRGAAARSAGGRTCPTSACWWCRTPRPASRSSSTRNDRGFRKRFAAAARAARGRRCARAFRDAGIDALELSTDDDLIDAIRRFADMRKRRSRLPPGGARCRQASGGHAMTFLWPEMLWLLLVAAAAAGGLRLDPAAQEEARAALRQPGHGARGDGRGPAHQAPHPAGAVLARARRHAARARAARRRRSRCRRSTRP